MRRTFVREFIPKGKSRTVVKPTDVIHVDENVFEPEDELDTRDTFSRDTDIDILNGKKRKGLRGKKKAKQAPVKLALIKVFNQRTGKWEWVDPIAALQQNFNIQHQVLTEVMKKKTPQIEDLEVIKQLIVNIGKKTEVLTPAERSEYNQLIADIPGEVDYTEFVKQATDVIQEGDIGYRRPEYISKANLLKFDNSQMVQLFRLQIQNIQAPLTLEKSIYLSTSEGLVPVPFAFVFNKNWVTYDLKNSIIHADPKFMDEEHKYVIEHYTATDGLTNNYYFLKRFNDEIILKRYIGYERYLWWDLFYLTNVAQEKTSLIRKKSNDSKYKQWIEAPGLDPEEVEFREESYKSYQNYRDAENSEELLNLPLDAVVILLLRWRDDKDYSIIFLDEEGKLKPIHYRQAGVEVPLNLQDEIEAEGETEDVENEPPSRPIDDPLRGIENPIIAIEQPPQDGEGLVNIFDD